ASQTNVTVNEYGTYAFVWEEQNGTVCPADRNTTMVTFYEQPSANAGSDSAVCGLDATLNALTGLGEGFWTALTDGGADVLSDSNAYQTAVTAADYGTRLYTWTQINGKACPSSLDTVAIEYVEQPIAFAGFDDRVCGLNYTLRAIPSSGRGRWTSITPGVTFSPDLNTPNASVVVPNEGMYGFVWTEENKLPCQQSSDTVWVEFINQPTGSLQLSTAAICLGDAANLTYLGTGTGPFTVTYSVNGVNSTLNSIANGFNFTVSPSITTIYQIVSITDGSGLSCLTNGGQGDTLTVFTRPTGIATGNYAVCNGESATVNLNLTGRPPFVVEMSTGETVTLQGPPYQYTYLPGPNTVRVISISDSVCAGTAGPNLANVTVNPLPVVTIQRATSGNICENDSVLLRLDRIVGTPPYRVFLSEGAWRKDTLLNGSTHLIYTRSLPSGLHTVSIDSIIDANGCKGLGGSISVLVNPRPNVAITSNSPICGGSTAEIRLAFTPANAGPWSLEYTVGSGSSTLTTPPLTAIDTLFFNPVSTTTYQFSRAIDVSTGCSTVLGNLPIIITVIPQPTLAVSVIDPVICANDSAEVELLFTGIAPFSITLNDGTTYAGLNNGDRITVNPTTTFVYTIVQFSDGSGLNCQPSQTVNFNIVVNPIPELSFDVSDTATCFPLIPLFVNTSAATDVSDTSYVWNLGNGETFRGRNPSTSYNQSGEYQITLSATSSNGCTNQLERTISMVLHPYPEANFSYEPEAPTVLAHQVNFTDLSQDAFTFRWTIDGKQISTDPSTTFSFPDDRGGLYDVCLYIESVHGCPDSICRTVRILDEATVFIPSAFTPNGDGLNEVFMPSVLGVDERDYQLIIFDRWGEVVFETKNPKQGWNGEYKNKPAKSDVYTWKVEYKQNDTVERKIKFGTVQLLR
ncbi:MAG TPA: T9SS type B sorting domain-containing protein, partial [Luteibaculaceae bacterium]|nr:T9SS type B sorting domain-containing protein [Luteibaculaceae bacterium]